MKIPQPRHEHPSGLFSRVNDPSTPYPVRDRTADGHRAVVLVEVLPLVVAVTVARGAKVTHIRTFPRHAGPAPRPLAPSLTEEQVEQAEANVFDALNSDDMEGMTFEQSAAHLVRITLTGAGLFEDEEIPRTAFSE